MSLRPGTNIAVKVPAGHFESTVSFYRDTVALTVVDQRESSVGFAFGSSVLWLDRVEHATHAEVWLELSSDDVDADASTLVAAGARIADEIEPLDRSDRHWIIDPAGTVLLLTPSA
ncbi:MAG: hypothetical protein V7636_538 [Actinomycetota bacterium]|jgi:predicted enzyme related to lactoylglutathione lyase